MVTILDSARAVRTNGSSRIVTVNGIVVAREAIAREIQNHPAPTQSEAWAAAALALVVRELLLQEARRLDLAAEPLVDEAGRRETIDEALMRTLVEREVVTPSADEASCLRYYEQNLRRFRSPDIFEVSHILLAANVEDRERRAAVRMEVEALIEELRRAPARFGAVAREFSNCPSSKVDGNLGQIGPGQTVPEFEAMLGAMPIGTVHETPVESRYGFHIVRIDRREDGRQLPFEAVRQRIADYLNQRVQRAAVRQYIAMLAGRSVIKGIELGGSPSPLVQ